MSSQDNLAPVSSSVLQAVERPSTSEVLTGAMVENYRRIDTRLDRQGDEMSAVKGELIGMRVELKAVKEGQREGLARVVAAVERGNEEGKKRDSDLQELQQQCHSENLSSFGSMNSTLDGIRVVGEADLAFARERYETEEGDRTRRYKQEDEDRAEAKAARAAAAALKSERAAIQTKFMRDVLKWCVGILGVLGTVIGTYLAVG